MRYLYLALGLLCVGLGAFGALVPLVPATPFVLLAFFFFTRSSQRLEYYILHRSPLRSYLIDFYSGSLSRRRRIYIIATAWASMILSTILVGKLWFAVMMAVIAVIAAIVIWRREPKPEKVARFWRRYEESARLQERRKKDRRQQYLQK
ncbi:YbaN family protein [Corynebacterium propinquum]|uniref:YbaN family protein n=1 Tax=Corynebacterium propinquum TaxID=43769 RepID=A0AAP4BWI2_9CORY|nr:YbaN family protein [Corynebacterium propinquum]MDK4258617.1 YbaN family protein [Corynebacterium propinquum]MDK4282840.1 YbaN family protein [Corynebacterium propinquum]MDK4299335.1 YbaN family protein [Corynebacterium propinquum]MDK4302641.1 YbaN family protein [Corynebacterium propinquum]MDK4320363.1 YbaN family protein [Corynebacterium propinquum]